MKSMLIGFAVLLPIIIAICIWPQYALMGLWISMMTVAVCIICYCIGEFIKDLLS